MPNEYPEHIDELDSFYKKQLADAEVAPPTDMWDRIAVGMEKENSKKAGGVFSNHKKTIVVLLLLLFIIATIGSYIYTSKNKTDNNTPVKQEIETPTNLEKHTHDSINVTHPSQTEESSTETFSSTQKIKKNNSLKNSAKEALSKKENEIRVEETKQVISETKEKDITVQDPVIEETPIEEKKPKKKVSFKDKYKKEYQDSTRSLFVPE